MLLYNLNPSAGLCNGTRILVTHLGTNVIRGLIIGGSFEDRVAIIPCRQYTLKVCYAMTINKSQVQTLDDIGIYLPSPLFSHNQRYVTLSRVHSPSGIHIVLHNDDTLPSRSTENIVYTKIFDDLCQMGEQIYNICVIHSFSISHLSDG
ncbi:hypothetical protein LINGRAHAP2_LOCUS8265 [Linum grandiflorum]